MLSYIRLFATPWTVACQAPVSTGFPRQEYWSGLPFPSPETLSNSWIEPGSLALAGRFFTIWAICVHISPPSWTPPHHPTPLDHHESSLGLFILKTPANFSEICFEMLEVNLLWFMTDIRHFLYFKIFFRISLRFSLMFCLHFQNNMSLNWEMNSRASHWVKKMSLSYGPCLLCVYNISKKGF